MCCLVTELNQNQTRCKFLKQNLVYNKKVYPKLAAMCRNMIQKPTSCKVFDPKSDTVENCQVRISNLRGFQDSTEPSMSLI